jgi:ribosomal protein S13
MARVAGVDLPPNKRAEIGLTYIYGVGRSRAVDILGKAGVEGGAKIRDLSEDELNKIRTVLDQEGDIEGDLRKRVPDGYRLLPWPSPSPQSAGPRSAHFDERPHPQRAA